MSTALLILAEYARPVAALLLLLVLALGRRWPAALDAAPIVAYGYTAQPRWLVIGVAFSIVRWSPPLALQAAQLLRAQEWHGLTLAAGVFALPGLQAYAPRPAAPAEPVRAATGATTRLDVSALPAPAPPAPAQTFARPMEPAEWVAALNDDPTAPHLGVVGPSQHGKTTFTLALAGLRSGEFVITTTKNDTWAGGDVTRPSIQLADASGSVDWMPVVDAIRRVHFEMLRRNVQNDTGAPPLTLIVDEFTTTLGNIPKATRDQILEIWSMGASCGVRTIVIAQEVNARAWGLEGRRDILDNLIFARVATGRLWSVGRLDPNGRLLDPRPLDTGELLPLARQAALVGRGWAGVVGVSGAPGSVGVPVPPAPQGAPQTHANPQSKSNAEQRITLYMTWRRAGMKSDVARALRHAEGGGLDDVEWAEAGKRLQTPANSPN